MIRRAEFRLYDGTIVKSPFWWATFWRHWHFGRAFGYPRCCVLRHAVDCVFGRPSVQLRGIHYRTHDSTGNDHWVPCGVFHRRDEVRR